MKKINIKASIITAVALIFVFVLSGCAQSDNTVDPGAWGYECKVIYQGTGGVINARELRTTYYLANSYLFRPSGSNGMLVAPIRDGYILAGWYTSASEAAADSVEEYSFNSQDRWDFFTDRVQGDIELFARWIPRGKVSYVNANTGELLFEKNITADSLVKELSPVILGTYIPSGMTFEGYYANAEGTVPYDFTGDSFVEANPTEQWLYDELYSRFPNYLEKITYVAPVEEESDTIIDTSWLFLNKLGYALTPQGEEAVAELAAAKNDLVEECVQGYLEATANKIVYLRFTSGT